MAYGWRKYIHQDQWASFLGVLCAFFLLASCGNITEADNSAARSSSINTDFYYTGNAMIYLENPIIASGNELLTYPRMEKYLTPQYVTKNPYLETTCKINQQYGFSSGATFEAETSQKCVKVLNDMDANTTPLQALNGSWKFEVDSDAFYQVNAFYHVNTLANSFLEALGTAHGIVHFNTFNVIPPATKYNFIDTESFWLVDNGVTQTLKAYSKCYLNPMNSYFDPVNNQICLGWNESNEYFRMSQDPSVIYHEVGHALVKIMMNQRNVSRGHNPSTLAVEHRDYDYETDLGSINYDEAGAINEGIADYFSYFMNNRKRIGEWGMGRFFNLSRPLSESDPIYSDLGISKNEGERLSYPHFLHFDSNEPDKKYEDVHIAGQIVSHFLVSYAEELKSSCFSTLSGMTEEQKKKYKHKMANTYLLMLLNETLGEIGDLTGKGSDFLDQLVSSNPYKAGLPDVFFTNLNDDASYLWAQQVNPPNFRRFFKIFAKNAKYYISNSVCPQVSEDETEKLLDEYGLLLFKSYGDNKTGFDYDSNTIVSYSNFLGAKAFSGQYLMPLSANTSVNEINRRNTILVSKSFLELPTDKSIGYVFDGQSDMKAILASLTFEGKNVKTTEGIAGVEYNNGNVKISPGEVVGLSLNLVNKSNSPMGGVQVLGNDWDHMKLTEGNNLFVNRIENVNALSNGAISGGTAIWSPCIFDNWPLSTEGGLTDTDDTVPGNCSYTSRGNYVLDFSTLVGTNIYPKYELDAPQPICTVQYSSENESQWVSQDFYRKYALDIDDNHCLNNPIMSGSEFNPNECLIRILPGGNQAVLGKIDPQKTWGETLQGDSGEAPIFNSSTAVVMEVNKWIQPGTTFNCRFRVRFTNCLDCYNNNNSGDDYNDYEYTGAKPFKIIDFKFVVID